MSQALALGLLVCARWSWSGVLQVGRRGQAVRELRRELREACRQHGREFCGGF